MMLFFFILNRGFFFNFKFFCKFQIEINWICTNFSFVFNLFKRSPCISFSDWVMHFFESFSRLSKLQSSLLGGKRWFSTVYKAFTAQRGDFKGSFNHLSVDFRWLKSKIRPNVRKFRQLFCSTLSFSGMILSFIINLLRYQFWSGCWKSLLSRDYFIGIKFFSYVSLRFFFTLTLSFKIKLLSFHYSSHLHILSVFLSDISLTEIFWGHLPLHIFSAS